MIEDFLVGIVATIAGLALLYLAGSVAGDALIRKVRL